MPVKTANTNKTQPQGLKVDQKIYDALMGIQFTQEAPVWDPEELMFPIPAGQYSVETRVIDATATSKSWTARNVVFIANGTKFKVRYRSGVTPDTNDDCAIILYVANRRFPTTSGKVIEKGQTDIFANNAAAVEVEEA